MQSLRLLCAVAVFGLISGSAHAQGRKPPAATYPDKPLRVVIPARVGGTLDVVCRLVAQKLNEALGPPVVVDNRTGAGGNIGTAIVAKSTPDGYTLACNNSATMGSAPALYRSLPFDMARDFMPVVGLTSSALILVVNPALPVNTLKEFIDYVNARPGKLFYGTSGTGVSDSLAAELFKYEAKLNIVHVPYKDGNLSTTDVIAGRVSMRFIGMAEVPLARAGKLKALAVTTPRRAKNLPDLPTIVESGFPQYEYLNFSAIYAPAATPKAVVTLLNEEVIRILGLPDLRTRFDGMGVETVGGNPKDLAAGFIADIARWKKVVAEAGISPLD